MKAGISLVPSDSIRRSQLNTSTAKQSYAFPKAKRFNNLPPNCPVAFYSNSCQLSRRRTGIGYGKKHDFTHSTVTSPPCNLYNLQSMFDKDGRKGKTMAVSREMSPEKGIINLDSLNVPGPGKYDLVRVDEKIRKKIMFTMRPKTSNVRAKKITSLYGPGPADYSCLQAFPKDGKCYFSKFMSSKYATIPKSQRFHTIGDSPGPQSYQSKDNLSKEGKYTLSQHKGHGTRSFTMQARQGFTDVISQNSITPGPGIYEKPSQFGVYGDVRYYKTLSSFHRQDRTVG